MRRCGKPPNRLSHEVRDMSKTALGSRRSERPPLPPQHPNNVRETSRPNPRLKSQCLGIRLRAEAKGDPPSKTSCGKAPKS